MATLYVDFENGDDGHGGTSFSLLASGADGRISGAVTTTGTFSSATANFPNDGSLIGHYLSIYNGAGYSTYVVSARLSATSLTITRLVSSVANQSVDRLYYIGGRWNSLSMGATTSRVTAGDVVRIKGSPAPTSLGQAGTWTSSALRSTKVVTSVTNTTPISVSVASHGFSTGDTVVVAGFASSNNANGTWEITVVDSNTFTLNNSVGNAASTFGSARLRNNSRVMLNTAVTQNIASTGPGRAAWTSASLNVTASLTASLNAKEHAAFDTISIGAGFTTGLAAYYTLPATLDLSGYQQISFWLQQVSGSIGGPPVTSAIAQISLCSDTAGGVPVNTISLPATNALGRWMPVTVDLGVNLGDSIKSIAFYIVQNYGAQVYYLNNIIACKASNSPDSLTLTSLIGNNKTGETFWGIQSINGRRVMIDSGTNSTPSTVDHQGYYGTTETVETVETWKRETIKPYTPLSGAFAQQQISAGGTATSRVTYSGGWDRVNMSAQTLETWIDGLNGVGYGFNPTTSHINLYKLSAVRFGVGIQLGTGSGTLLGVSLEYINSNNNGIGVYSYINGLNIRSCFLNSNTGNGIQLYSQRISDITVTANSNGGAAADLSSLGIGSIIRATAYNNGSWTIRVSDGTDAVIKDSIIVQSNSNAGIYNSGSCNLKNCLIDASTEFTFPDAGATNYVRSHNHDQVANNHKIFMIGALISSAIDQRYTASGISWKIQPTSLVRSSSWPVVLPLGKIAVSANKLVTVKAWMRRDNAGLTMRLVCRGDQIAGVNNDVTSSVLAVNGWEQQTITFTPTEIGVVEITAEAWGGTTYSGWVDDLTISQA